MPTSKKIILLDSMVIAGLFAVSKEHSKIEKHKAEWKRAIKSILPTGSYYLRVPTPVCYELMCWNKEWRDFILNHKGNLFRFAKYTISNEILQIASEYAVNCELEFF